MNPGYTGTEYFDINAVVYSRTGGDDFHILPREAISLLQGSVRLQHHRRRRRHGQATEQVAL
jgi:hypothetical protein